MATQLEETARVGGSTHRAATLTPQARRLLEGPVLRDAPAAGRPHGGADAAAGRDRRRRGGLRRAAGVCTPWPASP